MAQSATSSSFEPTPGNRNISWPTERSTPSNGTTTKQPQNGMAAPPAASKTAAGLDISNFPHGKKSLSAIAVRAYLLGTALGIGITLTIILAIQQNPLWRAPFYIASLSIFHFAEYWVTAQYNTPQANKSAFLLFSNGWLYHIAHVSALAECLAGQYFHRRPYTRWTGVIWNGVDIQLSVGLVMMVLGQVLRTMAMAQAASNFNHIVQVEHKQGHVLVKHGLYAFLRHPAYFAYFWWAVGAQLTLGNVVCMLGFVRVLWKFFEDRIISESPSPSRSFATTMALVRRLICAGEEEFLVCFFGDEYVEYRKKTWIGIPFI